MCMYEVVGEMHRRHVITARNCAGVVLPWGLCLFGNALHSWIQYDYSATIGDGSNVMSWTNGLAPIMRLHRTDIARDLSMLFVLTQTHHQTLVRGHKTGSNQYSYVHRQ